MQCLEVYASHNEVDQEALNILRNMKDFEENELNSYLENAALKPLDPSQQDFLQSFGGTPEFIASQLRQMSQQAPMMGQRIFPPGVPNEGEQNMMEEGSGRPDDSPTHSSSGSQGKETTSNVEHVFPPVPGGFPPLPLPLGQYPPMMMQQPFMMFHPSFFPCHPMPQMAPYPMIPPQMIRPNMMDSHGHLMTAPHPPNEQESRDPEINSLPTNAVMLNHEEPTVQEVKDQEESSHPMGTDLVATLTPIPPDTAFQLMPTSISPPEATPKSDGPRNVQNSKSVTQVMTVESTQPPPTPFEAKNPYDSVPIDKESTPVVEIRGSVDLVLNKGTSESATPLLDESQNLPCRRGKPTNQRSGQQQQRFSRNNPQKQGSRQNRSAQGQPSTKQELPTEASKPLKTDERPRTKESLIAKEPVTASADSETKGTVCVCDISDCILIV